jgi:crotonobetainyl-CoA:carnitine CoA-transferase CaiB-like acyl-CoA transferase
MPYDFSAASASVPRAIARRGEHNADALGDWLGYDHARIGELTAGGVLLSS